MISACKQWRWLLLLIGLSGCGAMREEVVPAELAGESSKLVVDCFISPQDSVLTAKVSRSRPILDDKATQKVEVTDAIVTLTDGKSTVKFLYNSKLGLYTAKRELLSIKVGVAYSLTVQAPDGSRVTATTTVPANVPLEAVKIDSSMIGSVKSYRVLASWQNRSHTYYRVKGSIRNIGQNAPVNASYGEPETILFTMSDNTFGLLSALSNDNSLNVSASICDGTIRKKYRSILINLSLLQTDAAYYRYHLALDAQLKAAGNPFAEAVIIPTNIQGGLGCFGSSNQSTKTVVLN